MGVLKKKDNTVTILRNGYLSLSDLVNDTALFIQHFQIVPQFFR